MRLRRVLLSILLSGATAVLAVDPAVLSDPALQARYLELTHEFRCVTCQNTTIADSEIELAGQLRRQVREMLLAGKSDEQVRQYMVDRYGEFILFRPRHSWRNVWLWWGPPIMLLLGLVIAIRVVRHRSQLLASDEEPIDEDALR